MGRIMTLLGEPLAGLCRRRFGTQIGPTCGFYAIKDAILYQNKEKMHPIVQHQLVFDAIRKSETNVGEMFSASEFWDAIRLFYTKPASEKYVEKKICDGLETFLLDLRDNSCVAISVLHKSIPHWILVMEDDGFYYKKDPNMPRRVMINKTELYNIFWSFSELQKLHGKSFDWDTYFKSEPNLKIVQFFSGKLCTQFYKNLNNMEQVFLDHPFPETKIDLYPYYFCFKYINA